MIIEGNPAGSVAFWSSHLMRDDTNERADLIEMRGIYAKDLAGALRQMEAVASGSRSQGNFMYAANINPGPGEQLTPEQWREAWDTLEKNLGLEGHQRIVVEHEKDGRTHQHAIWNRVDLDTMKVADMGGNWRTHERTARELEQRFDLTPTPSPDRAAARKPAPELWEIRAAEKSGIKTADVKRDLSEAWQQTDSGQAFAAAVEAKGYLLARGDRRDFVVLDQAGTVHTVARRVDGVTAADVRGRFADIDPTSLPSVTEAKATQAERSAERAPTVEAMAELAGAAIADNKTLRAAEDKAFWSEVQERREDRAQASQEAWRAQRDEAVETRVAAPEVARFERDAATAGLRVVDGATGAAEGLMGFLASLDAPATPGGSAMQQQVAQIRAQRRATAALESIRDDIEAGRDLKAEDVQRLLPTQLENIKAKGDAYILELVESMERRRALEREYGRERER